MLTPEPRAHQGLLHKRRAALTGIGKYLQEPLEPSSYVAGSTLSQIECIVVLRLTTTQLTGNPVQPGPLARILRERHVNDCPPNPSVSILERVDALEPNVSK